MALLLISFGSEDWEFESLPVRWMIRQNVTGIVSLIKNARIRSGRKGLPPSALGGEQGLLQLGQGNEPGIQRCGRLLKRR